MENRHSTESIYTREINIPGETSRTRPELLAPAGSVEAFYGAVKAGADAVYLAGDRFGARAYAENFTQERLLECIRYAHLFGRKVYLAVNTLFKERELAELYGYLAPFYEAGLDAAIVQDLGVLRFIREHFPGLALHASTQMTLCSGYGAALLREMGVSRLVPARELGLEELAALKRHCGNPGLCGESPNGSKTGAEDSVESIEIEAFVHGAMCYCYSGQCLFSSILGGRSGNRGRCAQPCRLPYSVSAGGRLTGECYPLSLKDMCTVEHIPELTEAGIDSFKIEGRMKKPEYAAGVTAIYRKYIDRYCRLRQKMSPEEAAGAYRVEKEDLRRLSSLYVRCGLQDGYYFRRNGREMVTLDSPAYNGSDDALLASIASKYLDAPLKHSVSVSARFITGEPASVSLRLGELSLSAQAVGAAVEPARNQPITEENIKNQLGRLGDSHFTARDIQVSVSGDGFYPLRQINELRREAVARLEQMILEQGGYARSGLEGHEALENGSPVRLREMENGHSIGATERNGKEPEPDIKIAEPAAEAAGRGALARIAGDGRGWAVSLQTVGQLCELESWVCRQPDKAAGEDGASRQNTVCRIYVDGDLLIQNRERALAACGRLARHCSLWIALPYIFREQDAAYMGQLCDIVLQTDCFQGFLARSVDEIGFLAQRRAEGTDFKYRADACLYAWNTEAVREFSGLGVSGFCLPYELKGGEQRELLRECGKLGEGGAARRDGPGWEKIVYSRIPMMVTANCVLRTTDRCRKGEGEAVSLRDRYRKEFPVIRNCLHCMNIIYNSVPFSLHQEQAKWEGISRRLDFTLETDGEMRDILKAFLQGEAFPFREYTTGHERRGVE